MGIIKKRKLSIEGMSCFGCEERLEEVLQKLKGIKYIKANYKKKELTLEYDLMEVKLKDIEQKVVDLGYHLPLGFLNKLKRWTIHFTEENEKDNYRAKGSYQCSKCPNPSCRNLDRIVNIRR